MSISNDQVLFVSGCGHSGTTLLSIILNSHPRIYTIKRETNWFNNYQADEPIICQEYLFEKNKEETKFYGKDIILEKTPNHVFSVELIDQCFPNCNHIFIVRNPLDTCASLFQRYKNIDQAINRWNYSNQCVLNHSTKKSCWVVRYENLITNTQQELEILCNFLKLDYTNEMLNYHSAGVEFHTHEVNDKIKTKRNQQVSQPIYNTIDNYQQILSDQQIKYVLEKTQKIRQVLGY